MAGLARTAGNRAVAGLLLAPPRQVAGPHGSGTPPVQRAKKYAGLRAGLAAGKVDDPKIKRFRQVFKKYRDPTTGAVRKRTAVLKKRALGHHRLSKFQHAAKLRKHAMKLLAAGPTAANRPLLLRLLPVANSVNEGIVGTYTALSGTEAEMTPDHEPSDLMMTTLRRTTITVAYVDGTKTKSMSIPNFDNTHPMHRYRAADATCMLLSAARHEMTRSFGGQNRAVVQNDLTANQFRLARKQWTTDFPGILPAPPDALQLAAIRQEGQRRAGVAAQAALAADKATVTGIYNNPNWNLDPAVVNRVAANQATLTANNRADWQIF